MVPTSPTATKTPTHPTTMVGGGEAQVLESQDLITSLPAPLFRLLVIFAAPISTLRTAAEVLSWRPNKRVESWMVVGGWWGICLGAGHTFKWLAPGLIFLPLVPLSKLSLKSKTDPKDGKKGDGKSATQSTTTESVLLTLNDLHSIQNLLPPSPIPNVSSIYARFRQLGTTRLIRGSIVIWITWIILGHIIGFRSLLAIIGTIILLLPSPTLAHVVDLLSKSLAIRRGVALLFLFTFGSPPEHSYSMSSLGFSPMGWAKSKWAASRRPSLAFSFRPKTEKQPVSGSAIADDDDQTEENPIYFRFEVHENQRWWMGLDWTSALLPQERPSWCDSHLLPVSPPASFSLPSSASIILPAPTKHDPHAKVKRTATWRWLDDDWSIVRAGAGQSTSSQPQSNTAPSPIPESESSSAFGPHVPRSLSMSFGTSPPNIHPEETTPTGAGTGGPRTQSIAEQAFTKGLERLKARTIAPSGKSTSPRSSVELVRPRTGSQASEDLEPMQGISMAGGSVASQPTETIRERDDATDNEGWVYGDNKWENMGAKGGLGRFTRRRRWHRRAVCTEIIEKLPSDIPPPLKAEPVVETTPILSTTSTSTILAGADNIGYKVGDKVTTIPDNTGMAGARDDVLRQRLKKAMGSMGG